MNSHDGACYYKRDRVSWHFTSASTQSRVCTCKCDSCQAVYEPSLQELWLQHNQIAAHAQLLSLSTLPSLAVLFLAPNPVCDSLKTDYRAATFEALTSLQVALSCNFVCMLCYVPIFFYTYIFFSIAIAPAWTCLTALCVFLLSARQIGQ